MGAIASGGVRLLNDEVVDGLGIPGQVIDQVARRETAELERRERLYRGNRPPVSLTNKTVILTDDGLATGSTMRAAVAAIRRQKPAAIVVAVPWVRRPRATRCAQWRMTSCASAHRIRLLLLACGIATSAKRRTRKCASC